MQDFGNGDRQHIYIGSERTHYVVHKALLCRSVPYFASAFNGPFSEAQSNQIHLNDEADDLAAFDLFCQWLYLEKLQAIPHREAWPCIGSAEMETLGFLDAKAPYHSLYYLAEKWCASSLKNATLECIRSFHKRTGICHHPSAIVKGYANTSKGSLLHRYLCDAAAFNTKESSRDEFISLLSSTVGSQEQEVWEDILRAIKRQCKLDEVTD